MDVLCANNLNVLQVQSIWVITFNPVGVGPFMLVYRGLPPPAIQIKPRSGFQKITIFTFSADPYYILPNSFALLIHSTIQSRWCWSFYACIQGGQHPSNQSKTHSGFQKMTIFTF